MRSTKRVPSQAELNALVSRLVVYRRLVSRLTNYVSHDDQKVYNAAVRAQYYIDDAVKWARANSTASTATQRLAAFGVSQPIAFSSKELGLVYNHLMGLTPRSAQIQALANRVGRICISLNNFAETVQRQHQSLKE